MNVGIFGRLPYDNDDTYKEYVEMSTAPSNYRLCTDRIYNKNGCLNGTGPIGTNGSSTLVGDVVAPKQKLVDLESILLNRNVRLSKSKRGGMNPVNPTKFKLKHNKSCGRRLAQQHSKLMIPPGSMRGVPIDRFYDLCRDPQLVIFENFEVNSTLEAKDNFRWN